RPSPVLMRGDADSGSSPTWGIGRSGVEGEVVEAAADALSGAVVLVGAAQAHDRGHQPAHHAELLAALSFLGCSARLHRRVLRYGGSGRAARARSRDSRWRPRARGA